MTSDTLNANTELDARFAIVDRLAQYPLINWSAATAKKYYSGAKDYNAYLKYGFESVESTLDNYSQRYDPLIKTADNIACRSLDSLEGNAKSVSNAVGQTKDIVFQTAHAVVDPVESSLKPVVTPVLSSIDQTKDAFKARAAKGYALSSATTAEALHSAVGYAGDLVSGHMVRNALRDTVTYVDHCVDVLLPAKDGEVASSSNTAAPKYTESLLDKGIKVQQKIQRRATFDNIWNLPRNAITGLVELTPLGYYSGRIIASTNEQVQNAKDIAQNTNERMHKLRDMLQDQAMQKGDVLSKKTVDTIHLAYDHVFAIMMNVMVLLNQRAVDATDHLHGMQTLARIISESKEGLVDKLQHSELLARLRSDTTRILFLARSLIPQTHTDEQGNATSKFNFDLLRDLLVVLENSVHNVLGTNNDQEEAKGTELHEVSN